MHHFWCVWVWFSSLLGSTLIHSFTVQMLRLRPTYMQYAVCILHLHTYVCVCMFIWIVAVWYVLNAAATIARHLIVTYSIYSCECASAWIFQRVHRVLTTAISAYCCLCLNASSWGIWHKISTIWRKFSSIMVMKLNRRIELDSNEWVHFS